MNQAMIACIQCPACGQSFLCQQQGQEGMVSCPHCAHQGPRGGFSTQGQSERVTQVRRRIARQPEPQPQMYYQPMMQPVMMPAQPQQPQPTPAPEPAYYPSAAPVQPPPAPVVWRQPPSASPVPMQPEQSYAESAQEDGYIPPHLRSSPWRGVILGGMLITITAAGGWFWWESTQPELQANLRPPAAATHGAALSPTAMQTTEPEVRKAELPNATESAAATYPPLDLPAITQDASRLIGELFAADTPEKRHACVYDGEKYAAEIEALLGGGSSPPPKLLVLSALKIEAHPLPTGQRIPLFNLTTSACKKGALIRLIEDSDGKRRIDWPLLRETHEQTLPAALAAKPEEPLWAWGRIMPSHGFELPAAAREQYMTFELHITADGKSPLVACVDRETPLGRYFDRETDWRQSYLVRLLLRKLPLETSTTAVLILDCEGTADKAARAKSP